MSSDPQFEVRPVDYATVKKVLAEAHYIGKPGSTSVRLGLYLAGELAGVITYGTIPLPNARAICGPEHERQVLELTRLALYDWAPRNSESRLIAASYQHVLVARPQTRILISYADGRQGHVGTIYQASNWLYTGASTGDVVYCCDDGRTLHPRTVGWKDLPPGRWVPAGNKYRYVTFIGTPTDRRVLRKRLRWPVLPAPKLSEVK
jgi:hypothetical protein